MHFNNREPYESSATLQEKIAEILESERNSAVSDRSIKHVHKYMRENAVASEQTLFPDLIAMVLPPSRTVPGKNRALDDDTVQMISESYDDYNLGRVKDPMFVKSLLPADMPKEEKRFGLTTPNPDYVWGKKKPQFPDDGPDEDLKALVGVCPGLRFPFLLFENASADKPIAKAENQAIRSGATLVNARRLLLQQARARDWTEPLGADQESFLFSCAWSPDRIILFVHWCQARQSPQLPIFHMTQLRKYDLTDEDGAGFTRF